MAGWLFLGFLIAALVGLFVWRWANGKRAAGYLAFTEYWVYTDELKLPPQEQLMDRMISANPHNRRGSACIGAREGMLFTDVRVHLAVALREKNPTQFRPDLFDEDVEPTKEVLDELSSCSALVKVRYASEAKLNDFRHLQFIPHMTDAISELMNGRVVFDTVAEKLYLAEEFREILAKNGQMERPDAHIRVVWKREPEGAFAQTLGLRKIGKPEIRTAHQEEDQQVLITGLLMRLAFHLFRKPDEEGPFEFDEFGDIFVCELGPTKDGVQSVSMKRRRTL